MESGRCLLKITSSTTSPARTPANYCGVRIFATNATVTVPERFSRCRHIEPRCHADAETGFFQFLFCMPPPHHFPELHQQSELLALPDTARICVTMVQKSLWLREEASMFSAFKIAQRCSLRRSYTEITPTPQSSYIHIYMVSSARIIDRFHQPASGSLQT